METKDLVQNALSGNFSEFDANAKQMLAHKVAAKLSERGYFTRMDQAKGLSEEKETAYQKEFKKLLKKYGAESPADLDDEKKKKFFDEVEKIKKD